jgi:outer membrane lipoprotein-sorting protein
MRIGSANLVWLIAASTFVAGAGQPAGRSAPAAPPVPSEPPKSTSSDDAELTKRLEAVDAAMARVADLRADFEQQRRTPLLKKPLVSRGVVLTKGELVRWDTQTPRPSSLLIGHGSIRMYYPADKLVEVYPVGEGFKDIAGAPLPRLSALKERFDIAPLAPSDLGATKADSNLLAVQLTPRSDDLRRHLVSVKVLIDESRPAATKVVMTDPDGDVTDIVFSNVRLNAGVKDEEIDPALPEGVRVSHPLGDDKSGGDEGASTKGHESAGPTGGGGKR